MKIGLVTLHNYNYGSALQCFALQSYLKQNFCDCELLCKENQSGRLITLFRVAVDLGSLCLKNFTQASVILRHFYSQRGKNLTLQEPSKAEIQRFVRNSLNRRTLTWGQLCQLGEDAEYSAFITGSDQVWNGARVDGYNMFFLRFAPKHKRIAYAPSFGGTEVADYNQKKYRKYISEFASLSARELSGSTLIREFTGREAPVLADPVCLLRAEQWRECIAENTFFSGESCTPSGEYVVAFFLNQPSDAALQGLRILQQQKDCPLYSFGYRYDSLGEQQNCHHMDGSPWNFLQMIDKATAVVTDSFHAAVFSLIFHTPFYVYSRNYLHSQDQSVRITELLKKVDMQERFNCATPQAEEQLSFERTDAYFSELREKSHAYLVEAMQKPGREPRCEKHEIQLVCKKGACCGCGACVEVCPVNAIAMEQDESGAEYPVIDREKCIRCGACLRVCALKKRARPDLPEKQKTYIGFGVDDTLTQKSSSGGIFSVLARSVLLQGGVVFGAAVDLDADNLQVRHICIENISQLCRIQGSKYTQSSTVGIFSQVKEKLDSGRRVLFSGTSCQVAALKTFLKEDYPQLYTVDLVCHGVPGVGFFEAHNAYLEKKYHIRLINVSFRRKDADTPYALTVTGIRESGKTVQKQIKLRDSAYYRLFMGCEGYRESCYCCPYASMKKPADITLGDYVPDRQECEALGRQPEKPYYSFIMVNSPAGKIILERNSENICKTEISLEKAQRSHHNLCWPSLPGNSVVWAIYRKGGFAAVERYIKRRNGLTFLPRLLKETFQNLER